LSFFPAGAAEAYESLRQRVLRPDGGIEYAQGRGVFIRCGLARWAQVQACSTTDRSPPSVHPRTDNPQTSELEVMLVKLIAGLILSIREEGMRV
jgi:hypothetical protein